MRFHFLQHADGEDIGNMRSWFEARGWHISSTQLHLGETLPDPAGFDWLGVMGGPMSAYDDEIYPWLGDEKNFIHAAIAHGKVVIGICLGSQLLADVLGGRVYRAQQQEIGWFEIRKNPALHPCGMAQWLPDKCEFLSWHGDTFDLPAGAVVLGASDCTLHQGFLWGDKVVALQFHLEAIPQTPEIFTAAESDALPPAAAYVQSWSQLQGSERCYSQSQQVMHQLLDHLLQQ